MITGRKKKPDSIDVAVGHRIRIQRLASGMSQSALADQLGVTFQQVQKYEKGVNRVGASRLTHIASALNVPVSQLIAGEGLAAGGTTESSDLLQALALPGAVSLLKAYAQIDNSELRATCVDLLRQIAGEGKAKGR
jgi:transcriptional regulator with XRE-family HTH domain